MGLRRGGVNRETKPSRNTHLVLALVLRVVGQGAVNDVAKVRLEADVEEPEEREDLIDRAVARRVGQVGCDERVLHGLQKLHRKEEKDTRGELQVGRVAVNLHGMAGRRRATVCSLNCRGATTKRTQYVAKSPPAEKPADIHHVKHILQE